MTNYNQAAMEDVCYTIREFYDDIIEKLQCGDHFSIYDVSDSWHHEQHIDKCYSLSEADEVMRDLSDYIETDTGLWEGLDPRSAISSQAAFTYGNAVAGKFDDIVRIMMNQYSNIVEAIDDYNVNHETDVTIMACAAKMAIENVLYERE